MRWRDEATCLKMSTLPPSSSLHYPKSPRRLLGTPKFSKLRDYLKKKYLIFGSSALGFEKVSPLQDFE